METNISAHRPGRILSVEVKTGDAVKTGEKLLTIA